VRDARQVDGERRGNNGSQRRRQQNTGRWGDGEAQRRVEDMAQGAMPMLVELGAVARGAFSEKQVQVYVGG